MEVRFKNFRCFKDTGLLKLKKITLLVGENSSGKTSFLAGLNHLSGLVNNKKDVDLNSAPFELGTFQNVYCSFVKPEPIKQFSYGLKLGEIEFFYVFEDDRGDSKLTNVHFKNSSEKIALQMNCNTHDVFLDTNLNKAEQAILKEMGWKQVPDKKLKRKKLHQLKVPYLNLHFVNNDFQHCLSSIGRMFDTKSLPYRNRHFIRSFLLNLETKEDYMDEKTLKLCDKIFKKLQSLYYQEAIPSLLLDMTSKPKLEFIATSPLRNEPFRIYSFAQSRGKSSPDGSHVPDMLMRLDRNRSRFAASLKKFGIESGLFKDIKIKRFEENSNYPFSIMVTTPNGEVSNLVDVGYGVSQIFPVIFDIISSSSGSQFLIQQPEVHLHPKAQAAFATLLADLVQTEKQFIIETHSDFILERLKYEIEQGNIAPDDVGILFFDSEKKGTKIHQIDLGKDGLPINAPASYRRFFLEELDKVWP